LTEDASVQEEFYCGSRPLTNIALMFRPFNIASSIWTIRRDVFRRHRWKWQPFRLLASMLPFRGLSICHVCALCSNGRRYRHDFFSLRQSRVSSRSC